MQPTADHFGVTVSDLETALSFYRDTLGLPVADRFTERSEEFNRIVGTEDRTADIAFLDAGDAEVELLEYDEQGENRNGGPANDVGVAHLSLAVEDVWECYEELEDDVDFFDEPQTLDDGTTVVSMYDPDGNTVEFID
jgi:catechol 2,3-dioxygenase-like lactoylglutathione lyase family enzyme